MKYLLILLLLPSCLIPETKYRCRIIDSPSCKVIYNGSIGLSIGDTILYDGIEAFKCDTVLFSGTIYQVRKEPITNIPAIIEEIYIDGKKQ